MRKRVPPIESTEWSYTARLHNAVAIIDKKIDSLEPKIKKEIPEAINVRNSLRSWRVNLIKYEKKILHWKDLTIEEKNDLVFVETTLKRLFEVENNKTSRLSTHNKVAIGTMFTWANITMPRISEPLSQKISDILSSYAIQTSASTIEMAMIFAWFLTVCLGWYIIKKPTSLYDKK